ncbi:MAG: NAD(P)H-hydrate epimerase [Saccharofermentans sp.]|nr:NAD(P)H-hydrate epimerase [Saccharofermentans sp.]
MIDVISVDNMRLSDAAAIRGGIPSLELMARAAQGIYDSFSYEGKTDIYVGSGNNGGDGFALACILASEGNMPTIVSVADHYSEDAAYYKKKAEELGVAVIPYDKDTKREADVIVDCLLGTGFKGDVRGSYKDAIESVNSSSARVVSADINSGLNGDSGEASLAVISDLTVSIGAHKRGLIKALRGRYVKAVTVVDIGIPINNKEDFFLTNEEWKALGLPPDLYIYEGAVTYYR